MKTQEELTVFQVGDTSVILVPEGRGEELRIHLASHGIHAERHPTQDPSCDRLEARGVAVEDLQAIVDEWER